jgi:hypothetical protein
MATLLQRGSSSGGWDRLQPGGQEIVDAFRELFTGGKRRPRFRKILGWRDSRRRFLEEDRDVPHGKRRVGQAFERNRVIVAEVSFLWAPIFLKGENVVTTFANVIVYRVLERPLVHNVGQRHGHKEYAPGHACRLIALADPIVKEDPLRLQFPGGCAKDPVHLEHWLRILQRRNRFSGRGNQHNYRHSSYPLCADGIDLTPGEYRYQTAFSEMFFVSLPPIFPNIMGCALQAARLLKRPCAFSTKEDF